MTIAGQLHFNLYGLEDSSHAELSSQLCQETTSYVNKWIFW